MTSKNGARQTFTLSSAWCRIDDNGGGLSTKHWTPMGASPRNEEGEQDNNNMIQIIVTLIRIIFMALCVLYSFLDGH